MRRFAAASRRCWPAPAASGAVATGDLLFSRAFAEFARRDARAVSAPERRLRRARPRRADAAPATPTTSAVTAERYLERCRLKTARLFESACAIGRVPTPSDCRCRFGREIGLAFQLLDDVLDVTGPPERTGKARGTDLLDGTVTLPLILARERDPELERRRPARARRRRARRPSATGSPPPAPPRRSGPAPGPGSSAAKTGPGSGWTRTTRSGGCSS